MDRDADGGYRMTFATAGAPPRTAKVVRAVGSRRYQQYLAARGRHAVAAAGRVPHRGEALVPDDRRVSVLRTTRPSTTPARPRYGGGVFDRHVTRWNDNCVFCHNVAPNPGRDPGDGRFPDDRRRAGDRLRGVPRPGRASTPARTPIRRAATRFTWRRAPTRRSSTRRACRPRAPPTSAGAATASASPPTSGRSWRHGDPFVAGDDLARYSRAARARHAAARRRDRLRRALLGGRHAAPDRLRVPGPAAVARARSKAASPAPAATACTRAIRAARSARASRRDRARGVPARDRGRPQGPAATCALASAPAARRRAHAPRSGGRGRPLRRLPHAAHRVRRARHPPQPPHRDPKAPPGRTCRPRRRAPGCLHALPRRRRSPARRGGRRSSMRVAVPGRSGRARGRGRRLGPRAVVRRPTSARVVSGRCSRAMASDRYPAVRHIAWRSLRRLIAPGAAPGAGSGGRLRSVGRHSPRAWPRSSAYAATLGSAVHDVDVRALVVLSALASHQQLEIGE